MSSGQESTVPWALGLFWPRKCFQKGHGWGDWTYHLGVKEVWKIEYWLDFRPFPFSGEKAAYSPRLRA